MSCPSADPLLLPVALTCLPRCRRKGKVVPLFKSEELSKDRFQLSHLFPPMKTHQLGRYRPFHPPQGRRAITKQQCQTAREDRPLGHSISLAEELPGR